MKTEGPRILILGGCGFIGRNLVAYLVSNNLVGYIRIVDKVPPQIAWLSSRFQKYFNDPRVEFKSANLINQDSCANAFSSQEGNTWDFVINCAGETKLGQTDPVYREGIYKLSLNCAKQAALCRVKRFIEISSGQMSSNEKIPHKEDNSIEPWTYLAEWKSQVENDIKGIPNLNYTILRPALVYGPGDKHAFTTRIVIASVYKHLNETMRLLWNADLKLNTVHVEDLCRSIWFVCNREDTLKQTYNVVDEADSSQGTITEILSDIFDIKVDYYGNLVSKAVDLGSAADEANDKHMPPWAEICQLNSVQNTPLSPHMDFELLLHKHLSLNGEKLKSLGFEFSIPKPNKHRVKEIIDDFISINIFPKSVIM